MGWGFNDRIRMWRIENCTCKQTKGTEGKRERSPIMLRQAMRPPYNFVRCAKLLSAVITVEVFRMGILGAQLRCFFAAEPIQYCWDASLPLRSPRKVSFE